MSSDMTDLSLCEKLDTALFVAINSCHSPVTDTLMWWISDQWIWTPLYLLIAVAVIRRFGPKRGAAVIIATLVVVILTDCACASVIRPLVSRMRPSNPDNPLSAVVHLVMEYRGGPYGFPSCHAANTMAFAVFNSLIFRNRYITVGLVAWSLLVAYSRIYIGVHYPGDILGGQAVGALIATASYIIAVNLGLTVRHK